MIGKLDKDVKIIDISDVEIFYALKKMCTYLVSTGWEHQSDDEFGAELNLTIVKSKKYIADIRELAELDDDLGWGCEKEITGKNSFFTRRVGDYNPWYTGKLKLSELLASQEYLAEILDSITERSFDDMDFLHFYNYLYSLLPKNFPKPVSITYNDLNPKIKDGCGSLYRSGHYSQAIFESCKVVLNDLKVVSGITNKDGKKLVEASLLGENPLVKLNSLQTDSDRDEQNGFALLFSGMALGIRNPKGHDIVRQSDKNRALQYLSFISLLQDRLDERITPKGKKK